MDKNKGLSSDGKHEIVQKVVTSIAREKNRTERQSKT